MTPENLAYEFMMENPIGNGAQRRRLQQRLSGLIVRSRGHLVAACQANADYLANDHAEVCQEDGGRTHKAIAHCDCDVAKLYRQTKAALKACVQ